MTKKRHSTLYSKPPSTAHRSSALSSAAAGSARNDGSPSVNELLMGLRTSQGSSDVPRETTAIGPSMPAEIRRLLDIPDTPVPRPRGRLPRLDAEGRRLPAGPAPPRGWLEGSTQAPDAESVQVDIVSTESEAEKLPGVKWPSKRSLVATCMREMARNWDTYMDYDRDYLGTLPTELRIQLLSHIAADGPDGGIGIEGLKLVLSPGHDQYDEFVGNDDFRRLDLSGSIGRTISWKQLEGIIIPVNSSPEEAEESWETAVSRLNISHAISTIPSDSLRYLSLSNPSPNVSWSKFLTFATTIPTLTHLSLAAWPTPSLTPNSTKSTVIGRYGRSVQAGGSNYYSNTLDNDWSEAAGVLARLSKSLYSLEWLDLDGCSWVPALFWSQFPCINWTGAWRKVEYISLHSNMIPIVDPLNRQLIHYKKHILQAMTLEKHIRKQRGWITVETDEWHNYDGLWTSGTGSEFSKSLMCEGTREDAWSLIQEQEHWTEGSLIQWWNEERNVMARRSYW